MKEVVVILSNEAEEVYKYLNEESVNSKIERTIFNSIKQKIELIKINPHYGDPISKNLFPKDYIKNYSVTNLFRIELPNFWRMIYTLTDSESKVKIIAFVLDIFDHDRYNKRFGYKGK